MENNKPNFPENIKSEAPKSDRTETTDRRDALQKLGRFAAYAAPFTVLALSQKADAATGHGPGKHP